MLRALVCALIPLVPAVQTWGGETLPAGRDGWTMTRIDLGVRADDRGRSLSIDGEMTLRLDGDRSEGPALDLNTTSPAMVWRLLEGDGVEGVDIDPTEGDPVHRRAVVRLNAPAGRGDEVKLRFSIEQMGDAEQLLSTSEFAVASWVEGWYPYIGGGGGALATFAATLSVPGTTTFNLPKGWIAITDGRLVSRRKRGDRMIEHWDLTDIPVARSFVVGPYRAAEREVNGRTIRIHLMHDHEIKADRVAELMAISFKAQEKRFGPFPFAGYGVVEVPSGGSWNAASQQTFMMAKSWNFDFEDGKLALWAHEMSHGWWGNRVGSAGFAAKMVGEALAQLGALIAIEECEGADAMIEFLEFSRRSWSDRQCARGYFRLADQGLDRPLSTISFSGLSGNLSHNLVNSKGVWVYHMLRREIGDEVFFATLRGLFEEFDGRRMSLQDLRGAFVEAAPDHDLTRFFSQWLDRTGAPRVETTWSSASDDFVHVTFEQTAEGEPFTLDLDVELVFDDGTVEQNTIRLKEHLTEVAWPAKKNVSDIRIDPDRNLLLWREAYAVPPSVDGVVLASTADWMVEANYEGDYWIEAFKSNVEVFRRQGGLFLELGGDARRLYPDSPHRFETYSASIEFDVDGGTAAGFSYRTASGRILEAVRVD